MNAGPLDLTQLRFAAEPGHVLIIEDDELIAAAIEDALRELGHSSFGVARSEREAVVFAARQAPQFITVDARLERGSGLDALQRICASRAVPVVVVTGDPFAVQLPGVVTLGKPFSPAAFRAAYEQALARPFRVGELDPA